MSAENPQGRDILFTAINGRGETSREELSVVLQVPRSDFHFFLMQSSRGERDERDHTNSLLHNMWDGQTMTKRIIHAQKEI